MEILSGVGPSAHYAHARDGAGHALCARKEICERYLVGICTCDIGASNQSAALALLISAVAS